jgi:putative methyltransferase (TIGR04325 family)
MNSKPSSLETNKASLLLERSVKAIKKFVRRVVENTPFISDFYYYWLFPKSPNSYRGVFKTFHEAKQAIPASVHSGYENAEQPIIYSQDFNSTNKKVLNWLHSIFTEQPEQASLFDLGGNIGITYHAYQKYAHQNNISTPCNLRWVVCDVPATIQMGKELLSHPDSRWLSYTVNFEDADGSNILITCGTLQYIETPLAELIARLKVRPQHILINLVPFYNGETYVTLQNIVSAVCPYKIQNQVEFLASLKMLGYELIDSWQTERTCFIPFHPKQFTSAYHGFYLRINPEKV